MSTKNSVILKASSSVVFDDDLELFFTNYEESLPISVPSFLEKQRTDMPAPDQ